ncbi:hypothetical protein K431DRAFT_285979 [Polychaeton citri CBS 116435]|uniref:MARVEL domain-containing protein n=1 Tax=Polychaeton citri CBS 116435 TaxID=1314669 RepID=A0A9P4Q936_9PEZI|nr:hypothetical protein K431DRAFT_285979 [Polychaeton citri CBS 116435]
MSHQGNKKKPQITIATRERSDSDDTTSSSSSTAPSLKSPRAARFAEATAVNSPIEPKKLAFRTPTPTNHVMAQPQISDLGFGYVNRHESVEMPDTDNNDYPPMHDVPKTPLKSPLKSAMKTPGAPPRDLGNILSPTFQEEEVLNKAEEYTEKQQATDVKIKTRVRIAKMLLRGVNFSCSLIVLAMIGSTFAIFNATKALPPRNNLPPWAPQQKVWPQILLLSIACISLFMSMVIFYAYFKGGHRRAEKAAMYYTTFAVAFFIFSIVMWGIGAGVLQGSHQGSNNKDMWGWACVQNPRHDVFQNDVDYDLICRLQNWSLVCCIIEVVVETITIAVYGVVFYRFYSKNKLRKSMAVRDRARSDMYLAQLRTQSAPNTPGYPLSPSAGGWIPPPSEQSFNKGPMVEEGVQYVDVSKRAKVQPFTLQPAPVKNATPKMAQVGFAPMQQPSVPQRERTPSPPVDQRSPLMAPPHFQAPEQQQQQYHQPYTYQQEHFDAAPGEQQYEDVPIPGAYASPLSSPTIAPRTMTFPYQR